MHHRQASNGHVAAFVGRGGILYLGHMRQFSKGFGAAVFSDGEATLHVVGISTQGSVQIVVGITSPYSTRGGSGAILGPALRSELAAGLRSAGGSRTLCGEIAVRRDNRADPFRTGVALTIVANEIFLELRDSQTLADFLEDPFGEVPTSYHGL